MIALAILDIPTGGIADMFGHKTSVCIGFFMQALCFLIYFSFPTYIGFLIGTLCNALGLALQSGATSSLIYELLRKQNLQADFQKISGRVAAYALASSIIGNPIGTIIYKFYPRFPYLLACLCFIAAAVMIYTIKWEYNRKKASFYIYAETIIIGMKLTLKNSILMAIVIMSIGLTLNRMLFNQNIVPPYLLSVRIDVAFLGFIASLNSIVQTIISYNLHYITKKLGTNLSLLLIIGLPSFAAIVLSYVYSPLAVPLLIALYMGHTLRDPIFAHISQEVVAPDKRSTMASTSSFLVSIVVGLLLPYWGKGIDIFGLHKILLYLGIYTLLLGGGGMLLLKRKLKL